MQDFTGMPAVVDLAAMREAVKRLGDVDKENPLSLVDLVIDHLVTVDAYGSKDAYAENNHLKISHNLERYTFILPWGQNMFSQFRVVPSENGICHQINLEYLAKTVWHEEHDGQEITYPNTLVATDSHTTMLNELGVLGWGVSGIEAKVAMLGQPVSMLISERGGI